MATGIEGVVALRTDIHEGNLDGFIRQHAIAVILVHDEATMPANLLESLSEVCAQGGLPAALAAIDAARAPGLLAQFGIARLPYLLLLRDCIALYAENVLPSADGLRHLLAHAQALDMDTVRAELASDRRAREALHTRRACPTLRSGPAITRN